jgi:hypothetical protein
MITFVVRRVVPVAALAVVLGALVRNQNVPGPSSDTWFHLRFGEEFVGGWGLRDPGHLGVFDSAQWVPTQWLPQVGMAWVEARTGVGGIVFVTGLLAMVLAIGLYLTCRQLATALPAAIASAVGMMAASPGLSGRPQLFSYLFVVATVYAWIRTARDGRVRWWVVGLAWLWPMLHGMWPVGISISLVAVVGLALQAGRLSRALLQPALVPVLSLVVAVLNPLGLSVVRGLLDVGSRSEYFAEWGATDFTEPAASVLAAIVAVVVLSGMRSQPMPWVHVMLALLGLAWGLYSLRTTPVAALILAPFLAEALQRLVPDGEPLARRELAAVGGVLVIACGAMALVAEQRSSQEVVAAWVDTRLDALPDGTRVLNDWSSGSYLLYRHPELDLVMHGYGDVFTDDELERNADILRLEPGWDDQVRALDAEVALLDPDTALGYAVEHQLGWTRVEADDDYLLLVPPAS